MVYRSSAEKAEDNHSSGILLVTVGAIGLIGDVFFLMKNPLDMPLFNRYLSCGIMGALFILFFVMGILSVRTYKIFTIKAKEENNILDQVRSWCDKELTKEVIEEEIKFSEESEFDYDDSTSYFRRCEYIKSRILKQFVNMNEELLDSFIDDYYSEIYGEEE
ncbi:MAG: hypothetical protein E7301_11350 [Butyrivibrio sp.]|nr:hypothetical protein [Butyrivibrio sp.]